VFVEGETLVILGGVAAKAEVPSKYIALESMSWYIPTVPPPGPPPVIVVLRLFRKF
jgi:hypothetical protein